MWWLTVAVEYGTAGEVTLVVVGAILGLVVARSIVAEADAHRLERPDRWWSPLCDACDAPLGATLTVCRSGHRQRRANTAILMLTPLTLAATSIAVPATTQTAWVLPAYWWFAAVVILLTVTDIDTKLIPNRILGPGTLVGVILLTIGALLAGSLGDLLRAAAAGALYLTAMVLLGLVARGALGFGDVKLAFLLGVFTGYLGWGQLAVAGLGAFILGGIVSIVLLATRRASRKDFIPFGPFMVAAAIIAVVFGDAIVDWYVG
jgi:leader peptidase (prepilin peptidase)/N-methyltransferase